MKKSGRIRGLFIAAGAALLATVGVMTAHAVTPDRWLNNQIFHVTVA